MNENELKSPHNPEVISYGGTFPPLGILCLAAYIRERGYEVEVIDFVAEGKGILQGDIYGITVTTFSLIDVRNIIDIIRRDNPEAVIILGGPHATIYPKETLETLKADFVIIGEGEEAFVSLLDALQRGKVSRRIWKSDSFIEDLDALPYPARDLTDINSYHSPLADANPTTTAFTSRGCPYRCSFCDRPALGKRFRAQSPDRVVDEMEDCEKRGIKEIHFYDDTFTVSRERVEGICKEVLHRGLTIGWSIRARIDTVDYSLLDLMKRAGLRRIHFGVETASAKLQSILSKHLCYVSILDAFNSCRSLGIKTLAYFMVGIPSETEGDMKENLKLIKRIKPDYLHATILTPFPATRLYENWMILADNMDVWRKYALTLDSDFEPPTYIPRLIADKRLKKIYRKFYLTPSYILGKLFDIVKDPKKLKVYIKAGLSIIRM